MKPERIQPPAAATAADLDKTADGAVETVDGLFAARCQGRFARQRSGDRGTTPVVFDPEDLTAAITFSHAWTFLGDPPKHVCESPSLEVRRIRTRGDLQALGLSPTGSVVLIDSSGQRSTVPMEVITAALPDHEVGEMLTGLDDLTPEGDDEPEGEGDTEPDTETPPDPDPEPDGDAADGDDDPPPPKAPPKKPTPRRRRRQTAAAKKD